MRTFAACSFVAALVAGCGSEFDPPSLVDGVRVLAVRPEPASGSPGESVVLEMLAVDGADLPSPRPLQIAWLGGCHNPPSRLYYACFPLLQAISRELEPRVVESDPAPLPAGVFGTGSSFSFSLPDDILSAAPRVATDSVHFGVSYLFFGVCAGELRARPSIDDSVPFACLDPDTGAELGSGHSVFGFTTLYSFEGVTNENPALGSIRFDSIVVNDSSCGADVDCDAGHACGSSGRCAPVIPRCAGGGACAERLLFPEVERASAEGLPGESAREILWANFYATRGEFDTPTQLVNDRATGFVEEHGAYFRAPEQAGSLNVWVTLHDQRGGAAFRGFEVVVRE